MKIGVKVQGKQNIFVVIIVAVVTNEKPFDFVTIKCDVNFGAQIISFEKRITCDILSYLYIDIIYS